MKLRDIKKLNEDLTNSACELYGIERYTITDNGSVDVHGNVEFHEELFTRLPIKFNIVHGYFKINHCKNLESLEGCPSDVRHYFSVFGCPKITSLKGCPKTTESYFECDQSNITSLKNGPEQVHGHFSCARCPELISLEGAPKFIGDVAFIHFCPKLTKLSHFIEIKGTLQFNETPINNMLYALKIKGLVTAITGIRNVDTIINKHLAGDRDIMGCQEELIEAGFEKYARLK
jgi:hypothetical protein